MKALVGLIGHGRYVRADDASRGAPSTFPKNIVANVFNGARERSTFMRISAPSQLLRQNAARASASRSGLTSPCVPCQAKPHYGRYTLAASC
jgi:hypothetical protein